MTLRGVIQGLLRGADDAEAMLADDGYGDLPAEMFGQALSSYADTAPMAEADALSPVLTTLDAGNASDAFAVLAEQPPTLDGMVGADTSGLGASILGASALDDALDDDASDDADDLDGFGTAAPDTADDHTDEPDDHPADESTSVDESDDVEEASPDTADADDPFAEDGLFDADAVTDSATEFEEFEEFFDTEPVATGEDPSDLDF